MEVGGSTELIHFADWRGSVVPLQSKFSVVTWSIYLILCVSQAVWRIRHLEVNCPDSNKWLRLTERWTLRHRVCRKDTKFGKDPSRSFVDLERVLYRH